MTRPYIGLKSDVLVMIRSLSSDTLALFEAIHRGLVGGERPRIEAEAQAVRDALERVNRELLVLIARPGRDDASALSNFVTYSRRLVDKLLNFTRLSAEPMNVRDRSGGSPQDG